MVFFLWIITTCRLDFQGFINIFGDIVGAADQITPALGRLLVWSLFGLGSWGRDGSWLAGCSAGYLVTSTGNILFASWLKSFLVGMFLFPLIHILVDKFYIILGGLLVGA